MAELEMAKIIPVHPKGDEIKVLFNPNEYRLAKSNQFAEVAIPGLSAPPLQFGRGGAQTLTLQLFFDTYDSKYSTNTSQRNTDVRFFTQQVTDLMKINPELHAPPICMFSWGNLNFVGVLEQATLRCTLFLPSGIPVRATLDVTFKQYFEGTEETGLLRSATFDRHYVVRPGDTLTGIAALHYDDPARWRPIAEKNNLEDPLSIRPGQMLTIPAIE